MLLTTFLKKRFDITTEHLEKPDVKGVYSDGRYTQCLFVYEKNNDSEPAFILFRSENINHWIVGNIYSKLTHHKEYSDDELRAEIKKGVIRD